MRHRADAVRQNTRALQFVGLALRPPLMPQELRACDSRGANLQPLIRTNTVRPESSRSPDSLVFRRPSTRCLELRHPRHCAPNHGKRLRKLAKTQNSDALTAQSNPMPSVPLQQDCVHSGLEMQQNEVQRLMSLSHSAPSLVRSLPPWSDGKRRSLRHATGIAPHSTNKRQRERPDLLHYTVRPPTAISEHHASRIVARSRTRPNSIASIPKLDRLLSLPRSCFAPLPTNGLVVRAPALHSGCRRCRKSATAPSARNTV